MIEFFWRMAAYILSRPAVAAWLIQRAQRTPYTHITSHDGREIYMGRWWLFNAYDPLTRAQRFPWCPISVRVHHIRRPDSDRHLHDHPWNARTVILRGCYVERCEDGNAYLRGTGSTRALRFGEFHRIERVAADGAWTMFISGRKRGTWGFDVDGRKVPYHEYLRADQLPRPAMPSAATLESFAQAIGRAKRRPFIAEQ